jgi:hypothetical protein
VIIDVPTFLVLYYPEKLRINLADMSISEKDSSPYPFVYDEATNSLNAVLTSNDNDVYSSSKQLVVPNIWAVRGVSSNGNATVAISSAGSMDLFSDAGDHSTTISISDLKIVDRSDNADSELNIALQGMMPIYCGVSMTLDLSSLNDYGVKSGSFSGFSYTITVSDI